MADSLLMTDLYQLTMAQAYFECDMHAEAVFDLFVRCLPDNRRFLLAAGLEQVVEYLESFGFRQRELTYLSSLGLFSQRFLDHLSTVRFTGTVLAMAEGTPCFASEPIVRVSAPIIEAQLVESRLVNLLHLQTLVASKAVRLVLAAAGRELFDFGMRHAHGAEAALYGARAAYLAGFAGSATVLAGQCFGIPLAGTMAHSFVEAHDREEEAFRRFVATSAVPTTLLIDTYDSERAARKVVALARQRREAGLPRLISAVRIDSGDLAAQAVRVRAILEQGGADEVRIVLSGGLNEDRIRDIRRASAPADAFGVGTDLIVSEDAPSLDMAYKLAWYADRPRRKLSAGKATWPGRKQVYRRGDGRDCWREDCIALEGEGFSGGEALLQPVMRERRPACRHAARSAAGPTILPRAGESFTGSGARRRTG